MIPDDATHPREQPVEHDELGVCDLCGEAGTRLDAVGHFRHPQRFGDYVLAHGECGLERDLELA